MPSLIQQCPVSHQTIPSNTDGCPFNKPSGVNNFLPSDRTQISSPSTFDLPPPQVPSPLSFPEVLKGRTTPLLYLPPLLSRLPVTSSPATPTVSTPEEDAKRAFSFEDPCVGLTQSSLPAIDDASVALHNALFKFRPTTENYYYLPYAESFNWNELVLPVEVQREWSV